MQGGMITVGRRLHNLEVSRSLYEPCLNCPKKTAALLGEIGDVSRFSFTA